MMHPQRGAPSQQHDAAAHDHACASSCARTSIDADATRRSIVRSMRHERRTRLSTCLASLAVLATVLASEPVHAFAPPAAPAPSGGATSAKPSGSKPVVAPQKPTGKPAAAPTVKPNTTPAASSDAPTPASAEPASVEPDAPAAGKKTPAKSTAKSSAKAGAKGQPKGKGAGGKRSVIDEEFLIEGKLEKPNAYYILRRSSVDFDWARLGATFSPLVLESVQDPLF